jgi:uncharacterized protein YbjT (DUF2867 family)
MYAIVGVSGHTGKTAADILLDRGEKIRVIVRDAAKGEPWKARGAEVAVAELGDLAALTRALTGVKGAYLLLPPDGASTDFIARGQRLTESIAGAISAARVPHVVFLSSIGAQHEAGTGPVRTVAAAERRLGQLAGTVFTFLRPAYFMENFGMILGAATGQGVLPAFFATDRKVPMIATPDIGKAAADALLDPPAANRVIELAGPAEVSFEDAAALLSKRLGKPVKAIRVPDEAIVPSLTGVGVSENVAGLYKEMSQAMDSGLMAYTGQPRRGQVTLEQQLGTMLT